MDAAGGTYPDLEKASCLFQLAQRGTRPRCFPLRLLLRGKPGPRGPCAGVRGDATNPLRPSPDERHILVPRGLFHLCQGHPRIYRVSERPRYNDGVYRSSIPSRLAPLEMPDFGVWQGAGGEPPERTFGVREDGEPDRNAARRQKMHFRGAR